MDLGFATHDEICQELGQRLKAQRLAQSLTQQDLGAKAGISTGTVKNIESKGIASLDTLVRVALALGLTDHLDSLFRLQVKSIAQMEQAEQSKRKRAPRKVRS